MKVLRPLSMTLAMAMMVGIAYAAAPAADDKDHAAHHPESASATAKAAPKPATPAPAKATPKDDKSQMMAMDKQMKAMQEMHEKMMNAKTPEERSALMADHMKTMHKGMSMMNGMMGSEATGKSASPEMMQKQTDMMQMMTDMMKDRMPQQAPAKK